MGLAFAYTLNLWPQLQVLLEDGRVGIDNNSVENPIRPTAVGKKNWLFIGEAEAGQRAAILYTLIESCRTHGLDPLAWLRNFLTRLPTWSVRRIHEITPRRLRQSLRHRHTPSRLIRAFRRHLKDDGALGTAYSNPYRAFYPRVSGTGGFFGRIVDYIENVGRQHAKH